MAHVDQDRDYTTEAPHFRYCRIAVKRDIVPIGRWQAIRTGSNFVEEDLLLLKADTASS